MSQTQREQIESMYIDCDVRDLEVLGITPSGIKLIQNERENDYGDAKVSHASIAVFWNEYLRRKGNVNINIELDATDVAVMLSLMKVSRLAYKRKEDSFIDFASYADFALQFEGGR